MIRILYAMSPSVQSSTEQYQRQGIFRSHAEHSNAPGMIQLLCALLVKVMAVCQAAVQRRRRKPGPTENQILVSRMPTCTAGPLRPFLNGLEIT